MRILHINCNYIGTTLHQKMIETLQEQGIDNQVFVPTYDKKIAVIKTNENVTVSECFKKRDRVFFDYKQRKILNALESTIRVKEFDCIHAYTLFTDGNCAMKLSQKYGIPYVVAIRNTDVNTFFEKMPILRKRGINIMRHASAIFFLSESYKKIVFEKYIPQKLHDELLEKITIIPNGIDDFWLQNAINSVDVAKLDRLDLKKIRLIYAGRIDCNKNIPTTQKAIEILKERGYEIEFTVVGKIDDRKEYQRIMNNKITRYIENQPKEKLAMLYRKHDIFVMPSYTESFGLVYAEAMSQGLPVVYTKGQGYDGQFKEGEVGFHVEADSETQIAEAIIEILKKYQSIALNCISKSRKFDWGNIVGEYIQIYYDIIAKEKSTWKE